MVLGGSVCKLRTLLNGNVQPVLLRGAMISVGLFMFSLMCLLPVVL